MNDERKTKKELIAEVEAQRHDNDALRGEVGELRQHIDAVGRVQMAAMSMRSSDDLIKVVATQYEELKAIFPSIDTTTINYVDEEQDIVDEYMGLENPQARGLSWSYQREV